MQVAKKDEPDQSQKKATINSETIIKSASEREDVLVSCPTYDTMTYRELQSLCKQFGIKANRKKTDLVEALAEKDLHAGNKAKEC